MELNKHNQPVHFLEEIHGEILKKFHSQNTKCHYIKVKKFLRDDEGDLRVIDGITFNSLIAEFKNNVYKEIGKLKDK